jgi:ABC-2 type transport system ATP-binding protein
MLELSDVKKKYGETVVLEGINLKVNNQTVVELLGENGIGKSTLLNIIGGMTKFEGEVWLKGNSLREDYKKYMKGVSLVGNTPFLYEYLTPSETIDMVLSFLNMKILNPELENLLEEIGLYKYNNILTRELSLGTRQKLSLILALIPCPDLILLDEPFVNLDVNSRRVVMDYLKKYVVENDAILIYATHSTDTYLRGYSNTKIRLKRDDSVDQVVLECVYDEA